MSDQGLFVLRREEAILLFVFPIPTKSRQYIHIYNQSVDPDIESINPHTEMRSTPLYVLLAYASSTSAFSAAPKKYQRISDSAPVNRFTRGQLEVGNFRSNSTFPLHFVDPDAISVPDMELPVGNREIPVADMERWAGGRLESAFKTAKEKGEAAFVAFITAGYPKAEGTSMVDYLLR